MRPLLFTLITGFAALLAAALPAAAENVECGNHSEIVTQLQNRYNESRHGMGIASNDSVLEIFASEASGTFSVLITLPSGQTCLIASGNDYQSLAEPLPAKGKGA